MRAIVSQQYGGPEQLVIQEFPDSDRISMLQGLGATRVVLEGPDLSRRVRELHPEGIEAVLEFVGNSTILGSLTMVRRNGRVCLTGGWAGHHQPNRRGGVAEVLRSGCR